MPEASVNEIIAKSRETREHIAAQRKARGLDGTSDATLRERASRAVARLERNTHAARSDAGNPRLRRELADPLAREREDRRDREFASMSRELRMMRQTLATRAASRDIRDDMAARPGYAEFKASVKGYLTGKLQDVEMIAAQKKAIQAKVVTSDDSAGGFLVGFELEKRIERVLATICAVRGLATVRGITTPVYRKPINVGGSQGGWVGEKDARPETSTPRLIMEEFSVHEYYAMPSASQTMFEDAEFDVEAWLADEVAIQSTEQEGAGFITGNGVQKPKGFIGGAYTIIANSSYPTLDQTTPSTYAQIGYVPTGVAAALTDSTHNGEDGLIDLVHALRPAYRAQGAAFLMSDLTLSQVRKFKDQYGQYLLAQPMGSAEAPPKLLSYPVAIDENMPSVAANAYPIAFANWERAYLVLDRVGMTLLRDPYSNKPYILFFSRRRVGGGVQNFEALKLLKVATS